MIYSKEDILKALSHVDDPDLRKDIVSLGMVRDVRSEEGRIGFSVYLTTPACPMKDMIEQACRNAVSHFLSPDLKADIVMTSEVTSRRMDRTVLPGVKNIIAVASGKGGVGKSTVSAGIAAFLAKAGASVGLLDADIYGPSIPTMFGVQDKPIEMIESVGRQLMLPVEKDGIKLFSIGFLSKPNEAVVWRGPMVSSAVRQFVTDVHWGELDYLIIDMPPGTGDVQITISQMIPLNGVVIVTTPQQVAVADARRAMAMFTMPSVNVPLIGIVENMAYFIPPDDAGKRYNIFGEGGAKQLSEEFDTRLLGSIPVNAMICETTDTGRTSGNNEILKYFSEIAAGLTQQVAISNSVRQASA